MKRHSPLAHGSAIEVRTRTDAPYTATFALWRADKSSTVRRGAQKFAATRRKSLRSEVTRYRSAQAYGPYCARLASD